MPQERSKDAWDKAAIILGAMGGFLTAIVVGWLGFWGSKTLSLQQELQLRSRLYAELLSKREDSDTSLRKEMFKSIIDTFLKPGSNDLNQQLLELELLTYNFHESLDLSPLLKYTYGELASSPKPDERNIRRLEKLTREVTRRQVAILEEAGAATGGQIDLAKLEQAKEKGLTYPPVIDRDLPFKPIEPGAASSQPPMHFTLQVLSADREKKELLMSLVVKGAGTAPVDRIFSLGIFDFPMVDNMRLPHDQRCAVVILNFGDQTNLDLVYFPGSKASLRDRPYMEDVLRKILIEQKSSAAGEAATGSGLQ